VAAQEQALALDSAVPPRTRQIVAFANGDHSEAACRALWEWVPEAYPQVPQLQ
jgi:IS1 family transposase